MWKSQQGLDQHASPNHLWNQVEQADRQGADAGGKLDSPRTEFRVECVGKREFPQSLDRFGDDEQGNDPTSQVTDRVEESIVSMKGDHSADAEERSCREIITGKRNSVYKPGDITVGGKVPLGCLGSTAKIETEPQSHTYKENKDNDSRHRRFVNHRADSPEFVPPVEDCESISSSDGFEATQP